MHTSVRLGFKTLEVGAFAKGGFSEDLLIGKRGPPYRPFERVVEAGTSVAVADAFLTEGCEEEGDPFIVVRVTCRG
jgi:hypothetical protein